MASVSFPQINTYRSDFPRLDFSALANLPNAFWQGQEVGRENKLRSDIAALGPNASIQDIAKAITAADPIRGAPLLQSIANQEAMNSYRQQSLVPDSIREYQFMYPQTQPQSQPAQPKTAVPIPAGFSGVSSPAPQTVETQPSFADFLANKRGGTPAERSVDTTFGKEYADWKAEGGYANVVKSLDQLEGSVKELEKRNDISGPFVGALRNNLPGAAYFLTPDAITVQQNVEEPIQTNLRKVLGAQYTQIEGENLLKRTYDPNLPEATNAARVRRVIKQIKTMARAKEAASRYYEKNGTLRGYTGPTFSIDDINPDSETLQKSDAQSAEYARPQLGGYDRSRDPGNASMYPETGPQPDQTDMAKLQKFQSDPEFRAAFELKYGAGSVDRWLNNEGWTGR